MDAIELLTADHDAVRKLFEKFRGAGDGAPIEDLRRIQHEIFEELETHTRIEEDLFYPAVRELGIDELTSSVAESLQEHHVVTVLMREIEDVVGEQTFEAKMSVLMENVEHHAGEEESELFPQLREQMSSDRLAELGDQLADAK